MQTLPMIALLLSHFEVTGLWGAGTDAFGGFARAAAPVAVTALWQGAVVAAGLALCQRLFRQVGAAHRFAAWAAGFSVLVALPFAPALAHLITPGTDSIIGAASPSLGSFASGSLARPLLQLSDRWSLAIAALWALLALARLVDLAIHTVKLRGLWKSATPIAMDEDLRAALILAGDAGQTQFELCTTRELDRPSVIGFFAPRILIPEWLLERLTRQELEQVVLHEAEHLRRRDDWTNLLQKLCLVVFPLNPALMFVERRLCREREMACDEGVVRRTQAPRAYAACLAGLAERHMEHRAESLSLGARAKALTLSAFERRPELARRVHSILLRRSAMHPAASRAMVGAVGCALVVGAVALAHCPQLVAFVPAEPVVTVDTAQLVSADSQGGDAVAATERDAMAASHFRAVNAMAIMPDTKQRGGTHFRASFDKPSNYKTGSQDGESKLKQPEFQQSAGYTQTFVGAKENEGPETFGRPSKNETAVPQELIVLTAFEQVQASGDVLGDKAMPDYGTDTYGRPVEGGEGRVTVTRLIFRVYSRATAGARESDGPGGSTPTEPNQAAAIPTSTIAGNAHTQTTSSAAGKVPRPVTSGAAGSSVKPAGHGAPRETDSLTNSQASQPHAVALGNGWFVIQL